MLVNRRGEARRLGQRRAYESVHVSPDGLLTVVTIVAANDNLWTMELDRPSLTRITFEAENAIPILSPDGSRLVYLDDDTWPVWDALPNGQGFLMIQDLSQPRSAVAMIQNWFEKLKSGR